MNFRPAVILVLAFVTSASLILSPAQAQKKKTKKQTRNEGISLEWTPTSQYDLDDIDFSGIEDITIRVEPFRDARREGELIGRNIEKDVPKLVTTPDDVAAFVTRYFAESLYRLGFGVVEEGGEAVISGELRRFFVEEDSTYEANILLRLTVERDGQEVLTTVRRGTTTRWGGSYEKENYLKTLSDSLVHLTNELAASDDFRKALGAD
jgi:hypothetical protein